jgi:hypothetical protein
LDVGEDYSVTNVTYSWSGSLSTVTLTVPNNLTEVQGGNANPKMQLWGLRAASFLNGSQPWTITSLTDTSVTMTSTTEYNSGSSYGPTAEYGGYMATTTSFANVRADINDTETGTNALAVIGPGSSADISFIGMEGATANVNHPTYEVGGYLHLTGPTIPHLTYTGSSTITLTSNAVTKSGTRITVTATNSCAAGMWAQFAGLTANPLMEGQGGWVDPTTTSSSLVVNNPYWPAVTTPETSGTIICGGWPLFQSWANSYNYGGVSVETPLTSALSATSTRGLDHYYTEYDAGNGNIVEVADNAIPAATSLTPPQILVAPRMAAGGSSQLLVKQWVNGVYSYGNLFAGTVIPSTALGYQGPSTGYVQLAPSATGTPGCLYDNGSGTRSWAACSGSSGVNSYNGGDVLCAHGADTTILSNAITAGTATSLTVATLPSYMKIPGTVIGVTGATPSGLNGTYAVTSVSSNTMNFASLGATWTSGGTVYLACLNSTDDTNSVLPQYFTNNTYAASLSAGQTLTQKTQYAYGTTATAPTWVVEYKIGSSTTIFGEYTPETLYASASGLGGVFQLGLSSPATGWVDVTKDFALFGLAQENGKSGTGTELSNVASGTLETGGYFTATGLGSITSYTSGATVTGSIGQTCTLGTFNSGLTGAAVTATLTTANTLSGATFVVTNTGYGATAAATTATVSSGSATCSGTGTFVTVLGGAQGNWIMLRSMKTSQ